MQFGILIRRRQLATNRSRRGVNVNSSEGQWLLLAPPAAAPRLLRAAPIRPFVPVEIRGSDGLLTLLRLRLHRRHGRRIGRWRPATAVRWLRPCAQFDGSAEAVRAILSTRLGHALPGAHAIGAERGLYRRARAAAAATTSAAAARRSARATVRRLHDSALLSAGQKAAAEDEAAAEIRQARAGITRNNHHFRFCRALASAFTHSSRASADGASKARVPPPTGVRWKRKRPAGVAPSSASTFA